MQTPSDTPTDLRALAAECERRAQGGEKPVLPDWKEEERGLWRTSPLILMHVNSFYMDDETCPDYLKAKSGYYVRNGHTDRAFNHDRPISSLAAAQLFAESLLRRATVSLHAPPEPRPIAGLPEAWKDGRDFLLWVIPPFATWVPVSWQDGGLVSPSGSINDVSLSRMTHFLPMPPAPGKEGAK